MGDEGMGDDVYQPTGDMEEQADAAPLDLEDAVDGRDYDDLLDEGYSPPERPLGTGKVGVTAAEQREGETLDERLAQEEPDLRPEEGDGIGDLPDGEGEPVDPRTAGARRAGRLVAPDEGARSATEKGPFASDVGIDGGASGAEEAAVHVVPARPDDSDSDTGG
ncbi:DUF5709 domain-containing protein [Kitasatospora purpeofusca]|uniref:DUF5709 domain-containing protein n=1 Tax=Kitasatospora purpeofusca TaxID=67352 RepID=UPI002A5A1459|nr:DUF5709 domain-containing protein [Kitasatospora purpeofusca]MDY0814391.1 DUF5709 domain-containing protein [Kitasatospora purpeofusca]